jgi:hypothetical protein
MVAAVLFTWPDRNLGPARTDLFRVKGMTEIVITCEGTEWRYPKAGSATLGQNSKAVTEVLLLDYDVPLNLASVPGAIAVVIEGGGDGRKSSGSTKIKAFTSNTVKRWPQLGRRSKASAVRRGIPAMS